MQTEDKPIRIFFCCHCGTSCHFRHVEILKRVTFVCNRCDTECVPVERTEDHSKMWEQPK